MKILRPAFVIGSAVLYYCVVAGYPLLETGKYVAGLFILCFVVGGIVFTAPKDDWITAKYLSMSLLPWALAAFFTLNGAFDDSSEVRHQTVVVEEHFGRGARRVIVQSWRPGETTVTLYVSSWAPFFLQGQPITVGVKSGALGIAWISHISRK